MPDCDGPVKARGWCRKHYLRWYKTGDPTGVRPGRWDDYERPTCIVDGCDQKAHARGHCPSHHKRLERHGDPLAGRTAPLTEFDALVVEGPRDQCWVWLGGHTSDGYGEYRSGYAHRHAVERDGRQIPDGHQAHHTCVNPGCVNPDHLLVLTVAEHRAAHKTSPGVL